MSLPDSIHAFWHEDVLLHDTGAGVFEGPPRPFIEVSELHPENAVRVRNIRSMLERGPLADVVRWHAGRHASEGELAPLHEPAYVRYVRESCAAGSRRLTPSTPVGAASWQAALAAAGTTLEALRAVLEEPGTVAYALVRPPGHHAQPARADGYCLFNNAALAAQAALDGGLARVAVVDWDVHHGNGTQECFWSRDDVLAVSLHMAHGSWGDSHPQEGTADEIGAGAGTGFNANLNLSFGTGDGGYERAMEEVVRPIVTSYAPDLLIVACGQDASQFDPNGRQCLTMAGFRRLGELARELAGELCGGCLLLVQEGGYGRTYSAYCQHATLAGVLGREPALEDPMAYLPDDAGRADAAIAETKRALAGHWF